MIMGTCNQSRKGAISVLISVADPDTVGSGPFLTDPDPGFHK
jgi:hypothetical protein